jgi:hypothetical protein
MGNLNKSDAWHLSMRWRTELWYGWAQHHRIAGSHVLRSERFPPRWKLLNTLDADSTVPHIQEVAFAIDKAPTVGFGPPLEEAMVLTTVDVARDLPRQPPSPGAVQLRTLSMESTCNLTVACIPLQQLHCGYLELQDY